MKKRIP